VTLSDLFSNARDAPLLLLGFGALLSIVVTAAGIIGRRLVASMARQGARVGTLERTMRSERLRRRQLEQCLREDGIPLPYWPDDPPELYSQWRSRLPERPDWSPAPERDPRDDPRDEHPETSEAPRITVPPLPDSAALARHRR
jgi:hypothetical protein